MQYRVELQTALGPRQGVLELEQQAQTLCGVLELLGRRTRCSGICLPDGTSELSGQIQTLLNTLDFRARGHITATGLSMQLWVGDDCYPMTGQPL